MYFQFFIVIYPLRHQQISWCFNFYSKIEVTKFATLIKFLFNEGYKTYRNRYGWYFS